LSCISLQEKSLTCVQENRYTVSLKLTFLAGMYYRKAQVYLSYVVSMEMITVLRQIASLAFGILDKSVLSYSSFYYVHTLKHT